MLSVHGWEHGARRRTSFRLGGRAPRRARRGTLRDPLIRKIHYPLRRRPWRSAFASGDSARGVIPNPAALASTRHTRRRRRIGLSMLAESRSNPPRCRPPYGIYAYTGREWDPEVGLYYYRARYYDPKIGRFLSEDPINFDGGINFFAYVLNSPTNGIDPFGLCGLGGCDAKMSRVWSPIPPEPTPRTCIAPADYACECGFVEDFNEEVFKECMRSFGATAGAPKGGRGTAYYGKEARKRMPGARSYQQKRESAGVARRQGIRACILGGPIMLVQIPNMCREQAMECVPMELKR